MLTLTGHSSKVRIRLIVNGCALSVAQVGEESLILRHPCQMPPAFGLVQITVDDHRDDYPVFLHRGISQDSLHVEFRDTAAPRPDECQTMFFEDDKPLPGIPF